MTEVMGVHPHAVTPQERGQPQGVVPTERSLVMRGLATPGLLRTTGIALLVVIGLLGLHLPHYLAETAAPADYARYPGLVLIAMTAATAVAIVAIGLGRRAGWLLGTIVAVLSCVLYVVQEVGGLPGLSQAWWEPTRLFSLLLAALFVVIAVRQLHTPVR